MTPALDDLLRDWTDYQRRNEAANREYARRQGYGRDCRHCGRLYVQTAKHEAKCSANSA